MKETNATVLAISLAVGFASKSNFNREFLRVTGVSPTQWRAVNARKGVT
ncbi:AraC family transcriptional regulator [uncultured Marivita sp.]